MVEHEKALGVAGTEIELRPGTKKFAMSFIRRHKLSFRQ